MLSRLDYESANSFLKMAKREIEKNNTYIVPSKKVNNKKYRTVDLLLMIGINSTKEVWDHILDLTPDDCIDISIDHDLSRNYNTEQYEFIKIINDIEVYIESLNNIININPNVISIEEFINAVKPQIALIGVRKK